MSEPLPQPQKPELQPAPQLIVGETPVYLTTPIQIGDQDVQSFVIHDTANRAIEGINSAVLMTAEESHKKGQRGVMEPKINLNLDPGTPFDWGKVTGVQWQDGTGVIHIIPKEDLSITQPADLAEKPTPSESSDLNHVSDLSSLSNLENKTQKTDSLIARDVLEGLTENPNVITIMGLKAYETRALDLADKSIQHPMTPSQRNRYEGIRQELEDIKDVLLVLKDIPRKVWKESIGGIYFHERARQYYMDMLTAAQTPFAQDAIKIAESRAQTKYDEFIKSDKLKGLGTQITDWFADNIGRRTTVQKLALDEITAMKLNGEIKGAETFDREAKAVRARFSQDFDKADQFIRKNLGEKLEILDQSNEEYKPIMDGIKELFSKYVSGEIADKKEFDVQAQEFFKKTLKSTDPKIFAETELYSSSLFDAAETLKAKMSHEGGLTNIDEAMAGMEIRLGLAAMGEVTGIEPNAVKKGVERVRAISEWLNKKNVLVPLVFNEATIGTGVALALSLKMIPQTMVSAGARAAGGFIGGVLAGGTFAGFREYGQLQKDYMTHLREREAGETFGDNMNRRSWMEKFMIKQRSADEIMTTLQTALYEKPSDSHPGPASTQQGELVSGSQGMPDSNSANASLDTQVRHDISDDDLRTALATVADVAARKAVSETGPKRVGLIQFTNRENIESQRTALDVVANKAIDDLETYLAAHSEQAKAVLGENQFGDFISKLTVTQTHALREGAMVLESQDDPIKTTLGLLSVYAPEAAIVSRRFPFASADLSASSKALGIDAIMNQFRKESFVEAVKYGARAGVVGAATGVAIRELFTLSHAVMAPLEEKISTAVGNLKHEVAQKVTEHVAFNPTGSEVATFAPTGEHMVILGAHQFSVPNELDITSHAGKVFDATIHVPNGPDIKIGDHMTETQLLDTIKNIKGLEVTSGHGLGETIPLQHDVTVPDLVAYGKPVTVDLPTGYSLTHVGDHYDIIFDKHTIASGLVFGKDGSVIAGADKLPANWSLSHGPTTIVDVKETIQVDQTLNSVINKPDQFQPTWDTMDLTGKDLGNGSIWNHFIHEVNNLSSADKIHDNIAAANGLKNMFRMHEVYGVDHDPTTGVPNNIDFANNNAYHHIVHMRPAFFQGKLNPPVQDIDLNRLSNDIQIHGLPEKIFGADGMKHFAQLSDQAIDHYNTNLTLYHGNTTDAMNNLTDPERAIFKIGYLGNDGQLGKTEYTTLMNYFNGTTPPAIGNTMTDGATNVTREVVNQYPVTHEIFNLTYATPQPGSITGTGPISIQYGLPSTITTPTSEKFSEAFIRHNIDTQPVQEIGNIHLTDAFIRHNEDATLLTTSVELPWFPVFLPNRRALEREVPEPPASVKPIAEGTLLSPYGESGFLVKEALDTRKSPRLVENPAATLSQKEEVAWYISQLSETDKATLAELSTQADKPMAEDVHTVVLLPTFNAGSSIYQHLNAYAAQTDPSGAPLDPKTTELVVYDINPTTEHTGENTVNATPQPAETQSAENAPSVPETPTDNVSASVPTPTEISTKAEVDRFIADHPDMSIIYLSHNYGDVILPGQVKRDATNYILDRINARPDGSPDVILVHDPGQETTLPATYLSSALSGLAENPQSEMVHGSFIIPQEQYEKTPRILAARRAEELLDALVRNGENNGIPNVITGSIAVRSGTLAAVGGYNPSALYGEDRELSHMIRTARGSDTVFHSTEGMNITASLDAARFDQMEPSMTDEELSKAVTMLYTTRYQDLKNANPARFDAYMSRALDTLGMVHEIRDGKIIIKNTTNLANSIQSVDIESIAKQASAEVVKATTPEIAPQTIRETLATLANNPELPTEPAPMTPGPTIEGITSSEVQASTVNPPEQTEPAEESFEKRIAQAIADAKDAPTASVDLSPQELMDQLKSTMTIDGAPVTGGVMLLGDRKVHIQDMKVHMKTGDASFTTDLIEDVDQGLIVDPTTIDIKLPLIPRLFMASGIKADFTKLPETMAQSINKLVDQSWKAGRIDIYGTKLKIQFIKK
jgi:hypothetical protein